MEGRWRICVVAAVMVMCAASARSLEYSIATTWNGGALDHTPVKVTLSSSPDQQHLILNVSAPFFNDPPAPPGPPGQPFYGLWDYEVVEAFFLNDADQYLEVEVCPWGQHIVLLLSGQRVTVRHSLQLEVSTQRGESVWSGSAAIPVTYLPEKVTKFNSYAIHGSGEGRVYEALYPAPSTAPNPDFHALQYFQPIDLSSLLPSQASDPMSQLWSDALQGLFRYDIATTWDDRPLSPQLVQITLQGFEAGVEMNVTAPFYNDPAPPGTPGEPYYGLWDYEVVEMFFLNKNDEYLEVELGPWGEHLLLLLQGERNAIKHSLPLDYIVSEKTDPVGGSPGQWKGSAMIPPGYFPPNVTLLNAYAIHGVNETRQYQALYPAPRDDPNYPHADFHRLDLFRAIDFEFQLKDNKNYSQVWLDAMGSGASTPTLPMTEDVVTSLGPLRSIQTIAPEPTETTAPEPAGTIAPEPAGTIAEELAGPIAPELAGPIAPEPAVTIAPELAGTIAQEPAGTIAPEPAGPIALEPANSVAPEPDPTETIALEPAGTSAPETKEAIVPEAVDNAPKAFVDVELKDSAPETLVIGYPKDSVPETTLPPEPRNNVPETTLPPGLRNNVPETTLPPEPQNNVPETTLPPEPQNSVSEVSLLPEHKESVPEVTFSPEPNDRVSEIISPPEFKDSALETTVNAEPKDSVPGVIAPPEHNNTVPVPVITSIPGSTNPTLELSEAHQDFTGADVPEVTEVAPQDQDTVVPTTPAPTTLPEPMEALTSTLSSGNARTAVGRRPRPQRVTPNNHNANFASPDLTARPRRRPVRPHPLRVRPNRRVGEHRLPQQGLPIHGGLHPEDFLVHLGQHLLSQQQGLEFLPPQGQTFQTQHNQQQQFLPHDQQFQPPVDQQFQPPVDQQFQPPVDQQFQPPIDQQFQPPRDQQFQPPLDQQFQPPADQQFQPPADQQFQPPADQQFQPPADQQFQPPADQKFQPPADEQFQLPADQQFQPPADQQFQPPADQQFQPPADQQFQPPADEQFQPPADQQFQPPADEQFQPPSDHQLEPSDKKFSAPQQRQQEQPQRRPLAVGEPQFPPSRDGGGSLGLVEEEVGLQEVEEVIASLTEGSPALPPPHPLCFSPGLIPDERRCWVFHECELVDGQWQVYSWKCIRGHVYDPFNVACVPGRCRRRG